LTAFSPSNKAREKYFFAKKRNSKKKLKIRKNRPISAFILDIPVYFFFRFISGSFARLCGRLDAGAAGRLDAWTLEAVLLAAATC
jgi:hypothetical protein